MEVAALRTVTLGPMVRLAPAPVGRTRTSFSSLAPVMALNSSTTPVPPSVCKPPLKFNPTSRVLLELSSVRSRRSNALLDSVKPLSTVTWFPEPPLP